MPSGSHSKHVTNAAQTRRRKKYVAALDVGTTTIRCHLYDECARIMATASDEVVLEYPSNGFVEINSDRLWHSILHVIRDAIADAGLRPVDITCLGLSVQRASFITWNRCTGVPFHNIITWRDVRAEKIVRNLNNSLLMRSLRLVSKCLYFFTGSERFLAGSQLQVQNNQVTPRLLWVLENNQKLKAAVERNQALFGTLDTWLIHKFTDGRLHVTDVSNAACTGFFDPFTMNWATWAFMVFRVPSKILPTIKDTSGDFGFTCPHLFGNSIPITSCAADQSASLFGSCAFDTGDLKITLGTGTFVDVNTGDRPRGSISAGIYPVVGWRIKNKITYIAESSSNDTGTTIKWAQNIGIIDDPRESSRLAYSVKDTDGVLFIPTSSGLKTSVNQGPAAAGLIGIKPTTSKAHVIRAILESIAFRIDQLVDILRTELNCNFQKIKIDGGVSRNDFVCQLIADLTMIPVERPETAEMSVLGAAYLAGISAGIWNTKEILTSLRIIEKTFKPRAAMRKNYQGQVTKWRCALNRFLGWHGRSEMHPIVEFLESWGFLP